MKCYTFCVSTLVKEPLEIESESVESTAQVDMVNAEVVEEELQADLGVEVDIVEARAEDEVADSAESDSEAIADVIELKPEDLADIKSKVEPQTEESIQAQVIEEETQQSEDLGDSTESDESESTDTEVQAEVEVVEKDSEVNVEGKANNAEDATVEALADIEEETDDATDDAIGEEKPSRSRALLLTSLLSTTKPISKKELKKVLKLPEKAVLAAIEDLKTTLYEQDLGLMMEEVAGGYRVIIQPNLYTDLAALISPPPLPQLSSAALETLAIVSYKQPITRGELEAARGTGCSSTLDTLQERDLIKIVGQKDVVGKPLLYATTDRFLLEFGLKSLEDLPPLDEKPTEFLRS